MLMMKRTATKKTIAVDFDGVLHGYRKKWHDGSIYDEPIRGAKEAMQTLTDAGYELVIFSTRGASVQIGNQLQPSQADEMKRWLAKHEIPYTRIHDGPNKPLCCLFIDDNAYRFEGDWEKELPNILKCAGS